MTKKQKPDEEHDDVSYSSSPASAMPTGEPIPSSPHDARSQLQQMFELPYILRYMTVNANQLAFHQIDMQVLEDALLKPMSSSSGMDNFLLLDIICKFLRYITKSTECRICSYKKHLDQYRREASCPLPDAPLPLLSPSDRLHLVKWLADQTSSSPGVVTNFLPDESLTQTDTDLENKVINAGQDSENRTYWYFDDLRLYRARSTTPEVKDWQCVTTQASHWQQTLDKLKLSTDQQDQELYTYLNEALYQHCVKPQLDQQARQPTPTAPSDDDIIKAEENHIEVMSLASSNRSSVEKSLQIKSANPELSKVLSEEPQSTGNSQVKEERKPNLNELIPNGANVKSETTVSPSSFNQLAAPSQSQSSNQVFVFPTQLANKAAEQVISGKHNSIIASHIDDPSTKAFLQKNPQIKISPELLAPRPHCYPNGMPSGPYPPQSHPQWGPRHPGPSNSSPRWPGHPGAPDISHSIVPDENLTPEQLQRREAKCDELRKLRQMLLGPDGGHQTDYSHIGMAQDRHAQPHMGRHDSDMFPGHPMSGPNGMPMSSPHAMPSPGSLPPGHPGQPMHPGIGHPGVPHPHMGGMQGHPCYPGHPGMPMMGMEPGMNPTMMPQKPPPPYPSPMAPTPEAPAAPTTGRKTKKRKSSARSASPVSPHGQIKSPKHQIPPSPLANPTGVNSHTGPHFPPNPNMDPNMPPGGPPMGAPHPGGPPMGAPHPGGFSPGIHHNGGMQQGSLMQAGPPEPYQSGMIPGAPSFPGPKPPPSYSASTKRGSLESMTTPPSQMHYYSQFDNQELTIVKQPNSAFRPGEGPELPPHSHLYGPGNGLPTSIPARPNSSGHSRPGGPGSPMVSRPASISNITSASLANLAKGVEQMQQTMIEGGPFRDIQQQQAQHQQQQHQQQPNQQQSQHQQQSSGPNMSVSSSASSSSSLPSVNNTYVNAHMSIGQVNIQNVNASQHHSGGFPSDGSACMQQNLDISMNNANINMMPGGAPRAPPGAGSRYEEPGRTGANVKVQNKGPNTIQYLPMSQQQAITPAGEPAITKSGMGEYLPESRAPRFPSPLTNLENKTPTSKISYYPDNSRLPPPPPQRLPSSMSGGPIMSQAGGMYASSHQTSMGMHPSPSPHMSYPGPVPLGPSPAGMSHFHAGHSPLPSHVSVSSSGMIYASGPGPMPHPAASHGVPPHSHAGMMDPGMMSPHALPHGHPGGMMMSHPGHPGHPPQSPYGAPGEFSLPIPNGYPGGPDYPGVPPGSMVRQMSHPGALPPQHMMMSQGQGQYMTGPGPPYMMG